MDPAAPLLFFDSGVGGLSVLGPTRALLPNAPIVYAADNAGFPLRQAQRGGDRGARPGAARPAGRALPPAARGDRLQHRLDHRARPCPRRARHSGGRHRPGDQAGGGNVEEPRDRRARHRSDRPPALCRRSRRASSRPTARSIRHGSPELVELAEAKLAGEAVDPQAVAAAVRPIARQPTATRSTRSSSPAPISRCSPTSWPRPFPASTFVDGGPGIARRIAWLTQGQPWPAAPPPGIAVFTGGPPSPALADALKRFGLDRIETL